MDDQSRPMAGGDRGPPPALVGLFAVATGALVANLYYAQPIIAAIAPEVGIRPDLAGAVVGVTQVGYGLGLFFLVPLADIAESRRLAFALIGLLVLGLLGVATSASAVQFFLSALLVGLTATAAQVLLPFIAAMAPAERRGRVVGTVMAGVLSGIMLARPVALFVSASFGWRSVFVASAALMLGIAALLARAMPRRAPESGMGYRAIVASMAGIFTRSRELRQRSAYQFLFFAAFNMFWTAVPLMLADVFGLGSRQIGLFALAGAGGALAAPLAGWLADRGRTAAATFGAMATLGVAFLATLGSVDLGSLLLLLVFAVVIDAVVQINQVVSQRLVFSGAAEERGRVNALYMTTTFAGGASGSLLGTLTYHGGGWTATALAGATIGLLLVLSFLRDFGMKRRRG